MSPAATNKKTRKGRYGKRRMSRRGSAKAAATKYIKECAKQCIIGMADKKYLTTADGTALIPTGGQVASLIQCSTGTGSSGRVANQILARSIKLFGAFNVAATFNDVVRLVVGIDHEANGAAPGVSDVLNTASVYAGYNLDKVGKGNRFRILYDKMWALNNASGTVTTVTQPVAEYIPVMSNVFYQSTGGAITDVLRNNIFYIMITDNAHANAHLTFQLQFTDV